MAGWRWRIGRAAGFEAAPSEAFDLPHPPSAKCAEAARSDLLRGAYAGSARDLYASVVGFACHAEHRVTHAEG